ncbi:MAG: phosphoenolpyruvate carboxylase, phosphoenolpyruvate carboxylase [Candidatus Gottesmanbacteria bacterium GW2011_GWA2_43_14]|uniref:Phosphoenolpyruvate carboxylase n=1 Tax=Candidatus Gottesmanbacteria bacterium GW2011_GWA2_43_14 TaxID=1618443 RepID=A0A0G1DEV4_9BACT|nr:MAG: phosphoenolpyruvate carboxylase, phosphoenolpyruvate carboxylase [Candidatus Gottesmanbacteria bacterium GW2011_GWA2_43_14]
MRKIPTTMATQHPDNAGKPYWHTRPFISSSAELKESYLCFSDLSIDEYNWDWEGKFVDEAVVDRLLHEYYPYFRKNPLGREKFLTFRFPNPRVEKQFRLARALMVAITSSQLSRSLGFDRPPIFEAILPLTETAEEIIDIQEAYRLLVGIEHRLLKMNESLSHMEIIPLFEQVSTIMYSDELLAKYIDLHLKKFKKKPAYIRPYCARSDPALNSGLVPTILALKVALSKYRKLEEAKGVPLYPMLGTGSLPFRGGLSPANVGNSLKEYAGVDTLTIQSAFRYDYPKKEVVAAIKKINAELPENRAAQLTSFEVREVEEVIPGFIKNYRTTVENIAGIINAVSGHVSKRRERMQHIGLFGYSRGVGKVQLPRAITFTAALYSLGVPPELIGTGRGLAEAKKKGLLNSVRRHYLFLKEDLQQAGFYLNKKNLEILAGRSNYWQEVEEDIRQIEKIMELELGPETGEHRKHLLITEKILDKYYRNQNISQLITLGGLLRRSLG